MLWPAETKEQVVGLNLLACTSLVDAIQIAAGQVTRDAKARSTRPGGLDKSSRQRTGTDTGVVVMAARITHPR
jgi:hypothetical protein